MRKLGLKKLIMVFHISGKRKVKVHVETIALKISWTAG